MVYGSRIPSQVWKTYITPPVYSGTIKKQGNFGPAGDRPRLSARRHSPRSGHRLAVRLASLTSLRRSTPDARQTIGVLYSKIYYVNFGPAGDRTPDLLIANEAFYH